MCAINNSSPMATFIMIHILYLSMVTVYSASQKEAEVNIFSLTVEKWKSDVKSRFGDNLISSAKSFSEIESECNSSAFEKTHIEYKGDPIVDSASLVFSVALQCPVDNKWIEKETTAKLIKNLKADFEEASGYRILKINEEKFKLSPPTQLNTIISVISVVVFIVMLAVLLILIKRDSKESSEVNVTKMTTISQ